MKLCWHNWNKWHWLEYDERRIGETVRMVSQTQQMRACIKCGKVRRRLT